MASLIQMLAYFKFWLCHMVSQTMMTKPLYSTVLNKATVGWFLVLRAMTSFPNDNAWLYIDDQSVDV